VGSANSYERELKGILSGDPEWIRRTTRTASPTDAECYRAMISRPFLVVRAAGSLGVDLVALRGDIAFPIEVKSSTEDVLRFSSASGANQAQAEAMSRTCAASGLIALYAFRQKSVGGDAWRLFALPTAGLAGRAALLYDHLPKPEVGSSGSYILRWQSGMPLARFLGRLTFGGPPATAENRIASVAAAAPPPRPIEAVPSESI
jgi:Holliday junction resolvase